MRFSLRDIWGGHGLIEAEVALPRDLPDAPSVHYLGREAYLEEFFSLLPAAQARSPEVRRRRSLSLPHFLWRRQNLKGQPLEAHSLQVVDLALGGQGDGATDLYTPQLRALREAAAPHPMASSSALPLVAQGMRDVLGRAALRVSREVADFELFYEHMYRPSWAAEAAPAEPLLEKDRLWRLFSEHARHGGQLLMLLRQRQLVCGALVWSDAQAPRLLQIYRSGLLRPERLSPAARRAELDRFEQGVLGYARCLNYAAVDVGPCRARADQPLTALRLRQGCRLAAAPQAPRFALRLPPQLREAVLRQSALLPFLASTSSAA